jgi:hypothetical protein
MTVKGEDHQQYFHFDARFHMLRGSASGGPDILKIGNQQEANSIHSLEGSVFVFLRDSEAGERL